MDAAWELACGDIRRWLPMVTIVATVPGMSQHPQDPAAPPDRVHDPDWQRQQQEVYDRFMRRCEDAWRAGDVLAARRALIFSIRCGQPAPPWLEGAAHSLWPNPPKTKRQINQREMDEIFLDRYRAVLHARYGPPYQDEKGVWRFGRSLRSWAEAVKAATKVLADTQATEFEAALADRKLSGDLEPLKRTRPASRKTVWESYKAVRQAFPQGKKTGFSDLLKKPKKRKFHRKPV
jgi:hypothetical protein